MRTVQETMKNVEFDSTRFLDSAGKVRRLLAVPRPLPHELRRTGLVFDALRHAHARVCQ